VRLGWAYESTYATYASPAAGDTFYMFGFPDGRSIAPPVVNQEIYREFSLANWYSTPYTGGKIVEQTVSFIDINGCASYLAFGGYTTTNGIHTITPSSTQKSIRVHAEERGGSEDIIRDALGLVVASAEWRIDDVENETPLTCTLTMRGAKERSDQDASNPAVQLSSAPGFPSGCIEKALAFQTSDAYIKWDVGGAGEASVTPYKFSFRWDNNLRPAQYVFRDTDEEWPIHAGWKLGPGTGRFVVDFFVQRRWAHEAIINGTNDQIEFKVVEPGNASNHYATFTLSTCIPAVYRPLHDYGKVVAVHAEFEVGGVSIEWKDGITDLSAL